MKNYFKSEVKQFEGACSPTWLNTNQYDVRTQNVRGITGFFKLVKKHWFWGVIKHGKEFHGYIGTDNVVRTTEGIY